MTENDRPNKFGKFMHIFEEGKKFTEELLRENERLRAAILSLKNEKRELEGKYVKIDTLHMQEKIRLLESELQELRAENLEIKRQYSQVEEENREFADRYIQVERQNSDLINMYVASYRLHSTLRYEEVLRIVCEVIINMVGAEHLGVYSLDEAEGRLVLEAHEGMDSREGETFPLGDDVMSHVAKTGEIYVSDAPLNPDKPVDEPVACLPLKIDDKVIGIITIYELLVQKDGFQPLDFELFEMLGGHAATALYSAKLHTLSERKRGTLEGFVNLLKGDISAAG